jgi:hypothetical protein
MAPKNGDAKYVNKGSTVSGYNVHAVGVPDIGWIENGYTNGIWEYKMSTYASPDLVRSKQKNAFFSSVKKMDLNRITINYTNFSNGKISGSLVDMAGRRVLEIKNSEVLAGTHSLAIDLEKLNSGAYVFQIQFSGSDRVINGNVVVIKE